MAVDWASAEERSCAPAIRVEGGTSDEREGHAVARWKGATESFVGHQLFGQLFDHIRDAVIVAEVPSGRMLLWNPAAEALFGYSEAEALAETVHLLLPASLNSPDEAEAALYEYPVAMPTDEGAIRELTLARSTGEECVIELSLSPMEGPRGERLAVAIFRDVSDRRRLQQRLEERTEQLAAVNGALQELADSLQQRVEERTRELADLNVELRRLAETDALTGLANRHHAVDLMDRFLALAKREGRPLCVAYIDFDHFKQVNDRHGHEAGDAVLRRSGELLGTSFRGEDVVARWGGEEVLIMMYGTSKPEASVRLGDVLDQLRDERFSGANGKAFSVSFSAGVAEFPSDGRDLEGLYMVADLALYRAKEQGRSQVIAA